VRDVRNVSSFFLSSDAIVSGESFDFPAMIIIMLQDRSICK